MIKNVKIKGMDIKSIRKILLKKGFLLSRKSVVKKQASLQNIYKVCISSLLIISFFYLLPTSYKIIHKALQPNLEIENSSNQKLTQVLEGKLLLEDELINENDSITDQDLVYQELYGEVIKEDDLENGVVKLNKLSDTLEHLADNDFDNFYYGDISNEVLKTIEKEGGHATKKDFETYDLINDSKFEHIYKDLKITGHNGPSIGGLMVLKYLDVIQSNPKNIEKKLQDAYLDRKDNLEFFGNRKDKVSKEIKNIASSPSTAQVNTSDTDNNHFSITFSSGYGSGVICKNTGMYLNNSLGEIELNPQGFLGETNGERLISNMSPLIINSKNGIVTIGSPGADRISSSLALVINNYTKNNNWQLSINEPRYHVNMDGTVRSEPGVKINLKNTTTTEANDMYFGGVCVTGYQSELFSYGDKRRGDAKWKN